MQTRFDWRLGLGFFAVLTVLFYGSALTAGDAWPLAAALVKAGLISLLAVGLLAE